MCKSTGTGWIVFFSVSCLIHSGETKPDCLRQVLHSSAYILTVLVHPAKVRGSGLFDKVERNSVVFPDGAVAWVTVSNEARKNLKLAPVCHNRQEFVRKDRRAKAMGASRIRGTQTLDRRWDGLDEWVGTHISTLCSGRPNPLLWQRVRSYQWRVQQRDVYKALGEACKA